MRASRRRIRLLLAETGLGPSPRYALRGLMMAGQRMDKMGWTRKSYDAIHDWVDPAKRERAEAALRADGLGDVIDRIKTAKNMSVWYAITQEAADAVGDGVIAASAVAAERELSQVAATLGRKGGSVKSAAKAAAVRENGKKGGRPKKLADPVEGLTPFD